MGMNPFSKSDSENNGHDEEIIPLSGIDPEKCEDMGGVVTDDGDCLMRKVGKTENGEHKYKPLKWRGDKKPKSPRELK